MSNDELIPLLMGEPFNKIELHNNDLMDFLIRVRKDENFQKLNFDYYDDECFNTMVRNTSKLIDISVCISFKYQKLKFAFKRPLSVSQFS